MVFPLVLKDCLLFPKPLRDGWFEFTKDHLYPKAMSLTQNVHLEGCEVSGERLWPRGKELKEALGCDEGICLQAHLTLSHLALWYFTDDVFFTN